MRNLNNPKILKAFYRLNGNADDYSGYENHGTINGNPTFSSDNTHGNNTTMVFDGDGDYITAANKDFITYDGYYTVSMWIKWDQLPENSIFFQNSQGSLDRNSIGVSTNNRIYFNYYNGAYTSVQSDVLDINEWHYMAAVNNGGSLILYVDDNVYTTGNQLYAGSGSDFLYIGKSPDRDATWEFAGSIDEIRIYNVALTAQEVNKLYKQGWGQYPQIKTIKQPKFHSLPIIQNSLVGAWGFKSAGQTANDVSSNNNDGSLEGGTIVQRDSSFLLDGSGDYVEIQSSGDKDLVGGAEGATFAAWIKVNNDGTRRYILHDTWTGWSTRLKLEVWPNDTIIIGARSDEGEAQQTVSTSSAISTGVWHHVVGIFDIANDELIIYVNGSTPAQSGTVEFTNTVFSTDSSMNTNIGAAGDSFNVFNGEMSQVAIYDRVLTEDEIKYIYKSSVPDDSLILHVDGTGKDITRYRHETTLNGDVIVGKYMEFDGDLDSVDIPTSDVIDNAVRQPITISGWIKSPTFSTLNDQAFFVFKVNNDNWQAALAWNDGSVRITNNIDGLGNGDNSSSFLIDDTWFFIAWVIDETTNKVYSNGELDSTIELFYPLSDIVGSPDFRIGTWGISQISFDGQINNVRIYDRALSEDEIKYMYNMEKKYY